ncbi:MAG: hypothetical protein MUP76_00875 [Acidimicrobiia bacterium]|nr:hypothetical protein [Acidimicrobiia bacterium]
MGVARSDLSAVVLCCVVLMAACSDDAADSTTMATPGTTAVVTTSTAGPTTTTGAGAAPALLIDSDATLTADPTAARARAVELDLDVLLGPDGKARSVDEITINLFPDTTYTGVITEVKTEGGAITWNGYLEGIEFSYFTMISTAGAFIGHFASPAGVYEVSYADQGVYRVVEIDQQSLPPEQ